MSVDEILFEVQDGGIAWLTFNRPDARNAMTFGMYRRLGEICRSPDPRMKVLILRASNDQQFRNSLVADLDRTLASERLVVDAGVRTALAAYVRAARR